MPARRIDTNTSFLPSITLPVVCLQRCLDLDLVHRHVARAPRRPSAAEISCSSRRKLLVEASFSAHQGQLVLHQRMVDQVYVVRHASSVLEDRAVAGDGQRRRPSRSRCGERAARGPGAAFEHAGQRHAARRRAQPLRAPAAPARRAAPRSARATRPPARRPTSQVRAAQAAFAQAQHAGVEQQAAVAVLGQAGQRVEAAAPCTPAHSNGSSSE